MCQRNLRAHMCRSVLVASFGETSLWARVRCAWRKGRMASYLLCQW
jgi:hypothetical protein